jgi:hypothetical protein
LAALVSGVTPVWFLGHKNEILFRWSLRLVFDTAAPRLLSNILLFSARTFGISLMHQISFAER